MLRGRGGGSRVIQRGGRVRQPRQRKNKPQCEKGKTCPFQHEHQHLQEFAHDEEGEENESRRGITPFQGQGIRLGASHPNSTFFAPRTSNTRARKSSVLAEAVEKRLKTSAQGEEELQRSQQQQTHTSSSTSSSAGGSDPLPSSQSGKLNTSGITKAEVVEKTSKPIPGDSLSSSSLSSSFSAGGVIRRNDHGSSIESEKSKTSTTASAAKAKSEVHDEHIRDTSNQATSSKRKPKPLNVIDLTIDD
jgi:hypothetical protein